MKYLHFTKMHGLGNDFIIIDNDHDHSFTTEQIQQWANRHTGIGFDQLLLVKKIDAQQLSCRIFNADGSEAEQCGNGLRCIAWWAKQQHLIANNEFSITTIAGNFPVSIRNQQEITLILTINEINIEKISSPLHGEIHIINLGNPHAILRLNSLENASAENQAANICQQFFPQGINVGFMQIISPQHIKLLTIERGAGKTYACGSNACAAALVGMKNGWLTSPVRVEVELGSLAVTRTANTVQLTGPAEMVYEGRISRQI